MTHRLSHRTLAGVFASLAILWATAPAQADRSLDQLFVALKAAPDQAAAQGIEQKIWKKWTEPADPVLAQAMRDVLAARRTGDYDAALTLLDGVIAKWPDYAEGWNQRATVHFNMRNFDKALEDISETLVREPRHFGSLAGRAVIRLQQGKAALGFQSVRTAMRFHPHLRERTLFAQMFEQFPLQ